MPKIVNVEEKKAEIHQAAAQVFFEKGYEATTLTDIAKAGNIGRSTIYQYFKNKEEIFYEFSIAFFSELVQSLDEIMQREIHATEKLKLMLSVFVFENEANTERLFQLAKVLLFLKSNTPHFENKFKFLYLSVQDMFFQVIEYGKNNQEIKDCDTESMTTAIFGLAQSIILQTYLGSQSNKDHYLDAVSLLIDGIKLED